MKLLETKKSLILELLSDTNSIIFHSHHFVITSLAFTISEAPIADPA